MHRYKGYPLAVCTRCGQIDPISYILTKNQKIYSIYTGTWNKGYHEEVVRLENIARLIYNTCESNEVTKKLWLEYTGLIDKVLDPKVNNHSCNEPQV